MATVFIKLVSVLMQVVLFVGQLSANVACVGECNQLKVPDSTLKK